MAEAVHDFSDGSPALVCTGARIHGDVKIGAGCVLHPRVSINAASGSSIEIGKNNVIEETVEISCFSGKLQIGSNNLLEVGCHISDSEIGSLCHIETKARLHKAWIADNCCVGAGVTFQDETLPANTSIFAPRNDAVPGRDAESHKEYVAAHLALLRKRLTKFQDLEPIPLDKLKLQSAADPATAATPKPVENEDSL